MLPCLPLIPSLIPLGETGAGVPALPFHPLPPTHHRGDGRVMAGDRLPRKVMDPKKLASLLRNGAEGTLVIDSRSFVEYNSWHVLSSVNICCSKLVKRRLQQDKVSITELIQPASKMKVGDLALTSPGGCLHPLLL